MKRISDDLPPREWVRRACMHADFNSLSKPYTTAFTTLEAERDALREALESIATRTGGFADGWAQGLHRTATDALRATYHTKGEERQ